MASALRMDARMTGRDLETREITLNASASMSFIDQLTGLVDQYDAVLSLACGAGVQAVAEVFPNVPILPALNTTFLGQTKEPGLWLENCAAAVNVGCIFSGISAPSPAAPSNCSTDLAGL